MRVRSSARRQMSGLLAPQFENTESGEPVEAPGSKPGSVPPEARTCPVCGIKFFAAADRGFCPVCLGIRKVRRRLADHPGYSLTGRRVFDCLPRRRVSGQHSRGTG
jgi:hypothetical protein